ncbi:hypothetical protein JTB14_017743 [Gonioctena quinquepunctata]|nr:hypothetical protein JTB14_017743 [Gonioctena quinquepunctata]
MNTGLQEVYQISSATPRIGPMSQQICLCVGRWALSGGREEDVKFYLWPLGPRQGNFDPGGDLQAHCIFSCHETLGRSIVYRGVSRGGRPFKMTKQQSTYFSSAPSRAESQIWQPHLPSGLKDHSPGKLIGFVKKLDLFGEI